MLREVRSAALSNLNGKITGVDAEERSRISTGSLFASRTLYHVGAGVNLSQLITDFRHTRESRRLFITATEGSRAAEQNARDSLVDHVHGHSLDLANTRYRLGLSLGVSVRSSPLDLIGCVFS